MSDTERRRLRRLAEELEEFGLPPDESADRRAMLLEEIDHALHPVVHERRAASSGAIVQPGADTVTWAESTHLTITRLPVTDRPVVTLRRLADGLSSWLVRRAAAEDEWLLFDRPVGSERDLIVLARALGAFVVQRHPSGAVRVIGEFGVLRWESHHWHFEPPVKSWLGTITSGDAATDAVMRTLAEFATHDLGAFGIGALLVYSPGDPDGFWMQHRLPAPPPLDIRAPVHLAPLRHVLSQIDGAAVFDTDGVLRHLGVQLMPSREAESTVKPWRGTRHTSALRFSYDNPSVTVFAVSEDGPVSVMRGGEVFGRSANRA